MDKKNNAQMKALLQMKQMVQDLIDEDFKTNKMPALMAMKVTKVQGPTELAGELPSDLGEMVAKTAADSMGKPDDQTKECEVCGPDAECECAKPNDMEVKATVIKPSSDSESVMKLKKLLGK